jgi:DUF917 family protein
MPSLPEVRLEITSDINHEVGMSKCNLAKQTPLPSTIEKRRGARTASESVEDCNRGRMGRSPLKEVGARVCVGLKDVRGVKEGVIVNHVVAHIVSPFENLGTNLDEKNVGGPPT